MKVSVIFTEKPEQWGLRGDPYFWEYLKSVFDEYEFPMNPDRVEEIIREQYKEKTGIGLGAKEMHYVAEFAHGGMSSGMLGTDFWQNRAIPLLKDRCRRINAGEPINVVMDLPVFCWKEDEENGYLSNWYRCKFVIDDFEYTCVEQYMMAEKAKLFHDSIRYTAILKASSPWEYKQLGKQVTPFDAAIWDRACMRIVKAGNKAKFEQNPALKKKLLATGTSTLAEASPKDAVWGIGMDAETARKTIKELWRGQNRLGKILMELRGEIAAAEKSK